LKVVPELLPNGSVLHFNKGTSRAGYRESQIFIGTILIFFTDYVLISPRIHCYNLQSDSRSHSRCRSKYIRR
jgi:hypothetical protein